MKTLLLLLISCSNILGQSFTFNDLPWLTSPATTSGWDGTPEGLGNMTLHWIYTNLPANKTSFPHATNWVDLIQSAPLNWNQLGTAGDILNTTTGLLSTVATGGVRYSLTNDNIASFGATTCTTTNFSVFFVFNQRGNAFQIPGVLEPVFTDKNSAGTYLLSDTTSANNSDMGGQIAGSSTTYIKAPNGKWLDAYLTISNGVCWTWTNGILSTGPITINNFSTPWASGIALFCNQNTVDSPWWGTLAECGIYTNKFFVDGGQITTSKIGVTNLHYYITNTPVAPAGQIIP